MTLFYYYLWLGLSYMGENMKNTHKSSSTLFNFFFFWKKKLRASSLFFNDLFIDTFLLIWLLFN